MSNVVYGSRKRLKLFTGFINSYLIEEIVPFDVSTELLKIIGRRSLFLTNIVHLYEGKRILSLVSLTRRNDDFMHLIYLVLRDYNSWNTKHEVLDTSSRCPNIQSDLNDAIFAFEKINFKWNVIADRNKWSTEQRLDKLLRDKALKLYSVKTKIAHENYNKLFRRTNESFEKLCYFF